MANRKRLTFWLKSIDRQVHFAHIVLSKVTCYVTIKLLDLIYSQQLGANTLQNSHPRQLIEHGSGVIYAWGKKSVEVLEDAVLQVSLDAVSHDTASRHRI